MSETYLSSGVSISAGEETVSKIKSFAKSTFNSNVLSEIGLFGAFYDASFKNFKHPVLVSSVDGVGTKLKVAIAMDKHDTIGQDLVNHCVNDIAVCGAEPLFFLDYVAFGKLIPDKAAKIIEGFAIACKNNNCSLIGGETAEMPGLYEENDYDLSGTIVGVVEKEKIINGKEIMRGDVLIGFQSNGLHTNGYSLARKVLSNIDLHSTPQNFELTLGDELLKIHKSYLSLINALKNNFSIKGFSHITGGGIVGNTLRIIPKGLSLKIDWNGWQLPEIFKLIKTSGNISDEEMRSVFNIGIGLIAVVDKNEVENILRTSESLNEKGIVIGEVI